MRRPGSWDCIPKFHGPYAEYLCSDEWDMRRAMVRWYARGRCERCGNSDRRQHVHHLTYERLGHERRADLVLLCERCHAAVHDIEPPPTTMRGVGAALERFLEQHQPEPVEPEGAV